MLIQDNPVDDEGVPTLHIDHANKCTIRWTQRRSDGALVDCEAQVQLIAPRVVRLRRPEQSEP